MSLPAREQARVLSRRYWAITLGDWKTMLLLIAQAPFIGWLCALVWGSVERDTPTLYFVMALSAVWFGCINACREIIKERAIMERERMFGLSLPAYVWSKLQVLGWLGLVQVFTMQMAIEWTIQLKGAFLIQTLALWGATLAGTGLGLLVSALSKRQEVAVGMVPLLIIPQLLFSEFSIPAHLFGQVMEVMEKLMPVRWAFKVFEELASVETRWHMVLGNLCVLLLFTAAFSIATTLTLLRRREV